jgi:hypothetical protein
MEQMEDWQKDVYSANLKANSISFNKGAEHGAEVERNRILATLDGVAAAQGAIDLIKAMPVWP